jgi:two-component system, OmpR family, response regulator
VPDSVLVELSGGEYEPLLAFLRRLLIVLTRDQLLDITRGRAAGPFTARYAGRPAAPED